MLNSFHLITNFQGFFFSYSSVHPERFIPENVFKASLQANLDLLGTFYRGSTHSAPNFSQNSNQPIETKPPKNTHRTTKIMS